MADGIDPLLDLPAADLAAAVQRGDVSAVEVTEAALRRIDAHAAGHAFITSCPEHALRWAKRRPTGPLAGVPLAVKDLFDTAGIRTTYGSSIFRDHVPSRTARVVRVLEAAGAIMVGKTNLHEFAWGVTSQNPHYGTVENPAHPGRVAGGLERGHGGGAGRSAVHHRPGDGHGRLPADPRGLLRGGRLQAPLRGPLHPRHVPAGALVRHGGAHGADGSRCRPGPGRAEGGAADPRAAGGRDWPGSRASGSACSRRPGPRTNWPHSGPWWRQSRSRGPAPGTPWPSSPPSARSSTCPGSRACGTQYGADLQLKLDAAQHVSVVEHQRGLLALREMRERARTEPAVDVVISPTLAIEPPPVDCWEPDVRGPLTRYTRPFNFLGWPAIAIGNLQIAGRDEDTVLGVALALEKARSRGGPGRGVIGGAGARVRPSRRGRAPSPASHDPTPGIRDEHAGRGPAAPGRRGPPGARRHTGPRPATGASRTGPSRRPS